MTLRSYEPNDESFILATWLRGLYYGNSFFKPIDKDSFMLNYHQTIDLLIKKEDVKILIACPKDDPDTILGYSVIEAKKKAIHWIYVKQVWRNMGISKRLIPQEDQWIYATHMTDLIKKIKPNQLEFNPYVSFFNLKGAING